MSGEGILVVEDDSAILAGLERKLSREGYLVTTAMTGKAAIEKLKLSVPDLVILDLMLPELDGLSVLRWLRRKNTRMPVLILSARGQEDEKIAGLRAGADDYLTKPFGLGELMARIDALLRRSRGGNSEISFGDLSVDLERCQVLRGGAEVALSKMELHVFLFLVRHRNHVVSREMIQASVWGDPTLSDPRAVDYHILNLRKKLEADPRSPRYLRTRHRLGYELVVRETEPR